MGSLRKFQIAAVLCSFLLVGACSDDSGETPKDGGNGDKSVLPDQGPLPTKLTCNNDCYDFVFDGLTFPDSTTASKIGHDYDNDGAIDNALGSILGALSGVATTLDLQKSIDEGMYAGSTIILLRTQAKDKVTDPGTMAQAWVGASQTCCPDKTDPVACKAAAKAGCFSGSHAFWPETNPPQKDALFNGSLSGGKFVYGPSAMTINLPMTSQGTLSLNLKQVFIKGKLSADGKTITDGVLAGAITKSDLDNSLIPTVTKMLNNTLTDPKTDKTTKDTILQLFDADKDTKVTDQEVKDNSLIKMFLAGDVDIDGDKVKELSLGIAFTAISSTIQMTPGPTPDMGAGDMAATGDM